MLSSALLKLGEPDLRLARLRLWIHGREREHLESDWLEATAHCSDFNANVTVTGSFLQLTELERWCSDAEKLLVEVAAGVKRDR